MKIRMATDSIRFRVRKSDLAELQQSNRIEDEVHFPSGIVFTFVLDIQDRDDILATCNDSNIIVSLPKQEAEQWMQTSAVSIEKHITLQDDKELHLLIEKDFPCLDREEENKEDTFWELSEEKPNVC